MQNMLHFFDILHIPYNYNMLSQLIEILLPKVYAKAYYIKRHNKDDI